MRSRDYGRDILAPENRKPRPGQRPVPQVEAERDLVVEDFEGRFCGAVVGYENPSTLQLVIESGALAVVERPIRPFGLLANLTIARSLWMERREAERRIRKLERKLSGIQKIQKAKSILMDKQRLSEEDAYQTIRRQAMGKRVSMDEMAVAIINANDLLQFRPKGD